MIKSLVKQHPYNLQQSCPTSEVRGYTVRITDLGAAYPCTGQSCSPAPSLCCAQPRFHPIQPLSFIMHSPVLPYIPPCPFMHSPAHLPCAPLFPHSYTSCTRQFALQHKQPSFPLTLPCIQHPQPASNHTCGRGGAGFPVQRAPWPPSTAPPSTPPQEQGRNQKLEKGGGAWRTRQLTLL